MSRLVPPQFDTYGRTFWIPSQVEPTVGLIGTSLPAIRQSIVTNNQHMSKKWSSYGGFSLLKLKHSRSPSDTAPVLDVVQSKPLEYRHVNSDRVFPKEHLEIDGRSRFSGSMA